MNKQEQINSLKSELCSLVDPLKEAFKAKEEANQTYHRKRIAWAKQFKYKEAIVRQIKILENDLYQLNNPPKARTKKTTETQARDAARKALNALTPKVRASLMANYQD